MALAGLCTTLLAHGVAAQPAGRDSSRQERAVEARRVGPEKSKGAVRADVTIRRGRVSADGQPIGASTPAVTYRCETVETAQGHKTVMTLLHAEAPVVQHGGGASPLEQAFSISRIEDAGDGRPPRIFNNRGVEVRAPDPSLLQQPTLRRPLPPSPSGDADAAPDPRGFRGGFAGAMVHRRADLGARQRALQQAFGRPLGRTGGLDRFVMSTGAETREALVDPEAAIPVEVNVARDGQLVEHTRHTYQRSADGTLVRRATHSEQLVPGGRGERLVVDVEFSDVRLDTGGAR
jgi:hypothetical protein